MWLVVKVGLVNTSVVEANAWSVRRGVVFYYFSLSVATNIGLGF